MLKRFSPVGQPTRFPSWDQLRQLPEELQRDVYERLVKAFLELEVRVTELELKLARHSGNSSKPPSSDGFRRAQRQSNRTSSGKKPGGQSGRDGTSLSQIEVPDQIILHQATSCGDCGHSIGNNRVVGIEKRQVFDLPPMNLTVTEHQAETKRCACDRI